MIGDTCFIYYKKTMRDFPGGPVVMNALAMQGAQG